MTTGIGPDPAPVRLSEDLRHAFGRHRPAQQESLSARRNGAIVARYPLPGLRWVDSSSARSAPVVLLDDAWAE